MKRAGVRVGVGTRFSYDGEIVEVVEMHSVGGALEAVARELKTQSVRRFALAELMFSDRARLLSEDTSRGFLPVGDQPGSAESAPGARAPYRHEVRFLL
jgi:hypothetical protein